MKRVILFLIITCLLSCKKNEVSAPENQNISIVPKDENNELDDNKDKVSLIPSGIPNHIAFGTEGDISQKDHFIKDAEYQYQYLAGDIFSNGWTTWNYPTGQFARSFLNGVGQIGKIPVFTYYNIVPAKGRYEDPGFTNLHDAEVMNKYFADWKLLLQICKEYGHTVIIHYEPDLFGYMQMFKADKAKNVIMVAGSNNEDVKGFENNAEGLAKAIVAMRDKYAPNVLLGWHASTWATGIDLIKGKGNPEQLALETANYYKSLNAGFDLFFSEFSDRDSGYDQVINGRQNAAWSTIGDNKGISDFDRFQRYLKKLNQETKRKIILWQIPVGNGVTKTCNNTTGHYKDNKAEFFLQPLLDKKESTRIANYGQAGVIAFLFGRGASNCTGFMDNQIDGVTSVGEAIDDDGGYLRRGIHAYYTKGAISLP
ncbi:hypothetical protein ACFQZI_18725 [Mucilaginibacter lutimaris]|uniref:Uncharacterized protein n=1 Tax=Mucilaginibacter lutimaris TaxID=931629 RepID=A0ABW2ZL62_9SPHI